MATMRQNPASPSRFSWFTFGKSANASLDRAHESELDDPWYIPYSGPIEPPQEPFRRRLERDSWGDPIEGDEDEDITGVRKPYETEIDVRHPFARASKAPVIGSDSQTGRRMRTQSGISGRTLPSDSRPPSILSPRRLTITTTQRLPVPQLASGGVGESPMPPPIHDRITSKERNGTGIAGLFSFGGQTKKKTPFEKELEILPEGSRKVVMERPSSKLGSVGHKRNTSTGSNIFLRDGNLGNGRVKVARDDDYDHTSHHFSRQVPQKTRAYVAPEPSNYSSASTPFIPRMEQQISTSYSSGSNTRHPYSYVFPSSSGDNGPQTALLPSTDPITSSPTCAITPTLTFSEREACLQKSTGIAQGQVILPRPFSNCKKSKRLKNSASTPDLHVDSVPNLASQLRTKVHPSSKIKERWLSAETWCDALLFPRPRLKMKKAGSKADVGRIVSLPPSPVNQSQVSEQGMASRVLVHSRSLADLDKAHKGPPFKELGISSWSGLRPQINSPKQERRPHQPRNWAFDDLALPVPVPSLAQVLEEGEKFENERRQWQDQATKSFQNKRTRNISLNRSKSFTHKRQKDNGGRTSNIDFLAASACLGSQNFTPVVANYSPNSSEITSFAAGPLTRTSRPDSDHIRSHWRSDLFGRTTLKKAEPIGLNDPDGKGFFADNQLENALKGDSTKIIRLADPALVQNSTIISGSPTSPVSFVNDAKIGVALTTPSLADNPDGIETMLLSSHPYAQGGLYMSRSTHSGSGVPAYYVPDSLVRDLSKETDSNTAPDSISCVTEGFVAMPSRHPYAHKSSSHDAYLPDTKYTYNDTSAPSRMWAQLSSGVIREVHPDDIKYSPFMTENGHEPEANDFIRNSRVINDTVGIGEALAFAVSPRTSKDSGLGTSEEHIAVDSSYRVSVQAKKNYKQPVKYDITRTPNLPLHTLDHDSAHTFASSPLLHQQQSTPDVPHYIPPVETTRTNASPKSFSRSLRSISDPDDLEGFYGLFYDSNRPPQHSAIHASACDAQGGLRRGVESELASLARQLSQELEQMTIEQEGSQSWHSSMGGFQSSASRKPTSSTLEFVFEETSSPGSETTGLSPPGQHTIPPFQPSSAKVPEDVELSRASSPIESDKDATEFCVGVVKSTSAPGIDVGGPQVSLIDQKSLLVERDSFEQDNSLQSRINPHSADPLRNSYTTSSTMSRMSTLSDFPAPPHRHAAENMSLSTSYFDETRSLSKPHDSYPTTTPVKPASIDDTMGHHNEYSSEEDIEELVAALSSHSHSTVRHN